MGNKPKCQDYSYFAIISSGRAGLRVLLAWLALLSCAEPGYGLSKQEQLVFVEEILFRKILLSNGNKVVRWERPPTLSVISGTSEEKEAFDTAFAWLNRPLRPVGYRIRSLPDGTEGADIEIYHTRYSDLPILLKQLDLPARFGELDKAQAFYNENRSLEKVYLFIDTRRAMSKAGMERRALKLLLGALGLAGETRVPVQSIFYEVPPFGMAEEPPNRLYPIDVKAIRLLYAYLEPGDTLETMRKKFRKQWHRLL